MGQAKQRGTREDRIQQAIERRHEEQQARDIIAEANRRQHALRFKLQQQKGGDAR